MSSRLWEARTTRGWTQEQAAAFIGCHQTAYSAWERGAKIPEHTYSPKIAKFIGSSEDEVGRLRMDGIRARDDADHDLSVSDRLAELQREVNDLKAQMRLLVDRLLQPPSDN